MAVVRERIVQHPARLEEAPLVTQVRSTLLLSSVAALRARGLEAAYYERLPPPLHETVRSLVAGAWLDLEVGLAHYQACEALELTSEAIEDNGRDVGKRVQDTVLKTLTRLATGAGVTPWTVFPIFPTLCARMWSGGGSRIEKVGPKDVTIEVTENPLMAVPYFRHSFRGVIAAALELFCRKVYAREVARLRGHHRAGVLVSWA